MNAMFCVSPAPIVMAPLWIVMARAGGAASAASDYAARFTLETAAETETDSFDFGDGNGAVEATLNIATITMWDVLPANASGDWTILGGGRVKLAGRTRLSGLAFPDSSDVRIDLAGSTLRVSSLTVDGVALRGTYTSATLPSILVGEGSLEVLHPATMFTVR